MEKIKWNNIENEAPEDGIKCITTLGCSQYGTYLDYVTYSDGSGILTKGFWKKNDMDWHRVRARFWIPVEDPK